MDLRTPQSDTAFRLEGVSKSFVRTGSFTDWLRPSRRERVPVLNDLSLTLKTGRITGLAGVNGSGKTTLLRILCGLLLPDTGLVEVLGRSPARDRENLAEDIGLILPNERSFFWRLSIRRNLEFFAVLNNIARPDLRRRVEEVVTKVGLSDRIDTPFRDLSDGMKQRVAVARGLLRPARLILADEATRSLDPAGASRIRDLLRHEVEHRACGVLIVSHNLTELIDFCDEIALLEDGRIRLSGPPASCADAIRARFAEREATT